MKNGIKMTNEQRLKLISAAALKGYGSLTELANSMESFEGHYNSLQALSDRLRGAVKWTQTEISELLNKLDAEYTDFFS